MLNKDDYPIRVAQIMGKFNAGGIKSVLLNYYNNIDKDKIQFDFIIDNDSMSHDYSEVELMGGKVYKVPPVKDLIHYIPTLYKLLKTNDYKIVHAYINTLNIFPLFVSYLANIPVRIGENLSTAHYGESKTRLKALLKPFAKLFANRYAACSKLAGKWMYGEKTLRNGKVKIFNNAIDLDKFHYNPQLRNETRRKYKLEGMFVIGHIGRYQYQKNHNFLIDIFDEIHKLDDSTILVLIGYGNLKDSIFEKIAKLGLTDYVVDLGAREDIAQFYNAMDCFVLPSFYEGLPVVGVESQATGVPCIMSTEVTRETKITDITEFINLDESAEMWAKRILKWKNYKRKRVDDQITASGYNIKNEAHLLKEYYIDSLNELCETKLFN